MGKKSQHPRKGESVPQEQSTDTQRAEADEKVQPPATPIEAHHPEDVEKQTNRQKRDALDWIKLGFEVLGFFVLVFYACETKRTNNLTQQSLKANKSQFQQDQRPYVVIDDLVQATGSTITEGHFTFWNVSYSNYGKSPAIRCVLDMKMFIGSPVDNLKAVDSWWVAEIEGRTFRGPESVLAPNGFGALPPDTVPNPNSNEWQRRPKGQGYSTAKSEGPLRIEDTLLIRTIFHALIVAGRMQYYDLAGRMYETDFCLGTGPGGVIGGCPTHNEIR